MQDIYEVKIKKLRIENLIKQKGYSKSEISRRISKLIGKKENPMYVSNALRNLKKMDRLEMLENNILEVLK